MESHDDEVNASIRVGNHRLYKDLLDANGSEENGLMNQPMSNEQKLARERAQLFDKVLARYPRLVHVDIERKSNRELQAMLRPATVAPVTTAVAPSKLPVGEPSTKSAAGRARTPRAARKRSPKPQ